MPLNHVPSASRAARAKPVEDSLLKRYFFKVGGGLLSLPINLAIQAMVPRALGPAAYGNYSFLNNFFTQFVGFFDSGTSLGFYIKLCKRPREKSLVTFYWRFVAAVAFLTGVLVIGLSAVCQEQIWPGQSRRYIYLAAIFGVGGWFLSVAEKILDAHGLSAPGEFARVAQRIIGLALIGSLFWIGCLNLTWYFLVQIFLVGCLVFFWKRVLKKNGESLCPNERLPIDLLKQYGHEFWDYSHPLLFYALIGMVAGIADRWLLQLFAGSVEQGFFGLSYQISAVCFLFTGAMTPLLTREFAQAHHDGDLSRMRQDFMKYIPRFYAISAFVAVFLASQANTVTRLFGGAQFKEANTAIMLMCLYPIHQVYGQLSASVFYATGQTKLYRNIGITTMGLGLILSFWLLGPKGLGGLSLGATGLAVKMLVAQFLVINTQLWFNARLLKVSFWRFINHQLYSVALLAGAAWLAGRCGQGLFQAPFSSFLAGGFIYLLAGFGLLFLFPKMFATTRKELWKHLRNGVNKFFSA